MNLNEVLRDADMILVGIGEEFQEKFLDFPLFDEKNPTILEEYDRKKYLDNCENDDIIEAYRILEKLLVSKNYFVITLCNDDKIFKTQINPDRIVSPCGSYSYLQCEEVCTKDIYSIKEFESELGEGKEPTCPHCGKKLVVNRIGCGKYSEEGYLNKWNLYMKWLQGTLNKNICIIELGVGMKYPSVIRWPFEKIAFINKKAKFIRVHELFYQLTEEISEKGVSLKANPVDFLRNQIV